MTLPLRLRILVVDDELLLRWSLAEVLNHHGHSVYEADSATAARAAIADAPRPFDVVLLDLRLPDSDDLEMLAELRRRCPTTAVVLMTAFGTPETVEGALALGAYRVVDKPFDMLGVDALVRSAHRATGSHQA